MDSILLEMAALRQATEDREKKEFSTHPAYKWACHNTTWSHDQKAAFAVWTNGNTGRLFESLSKEFEVNYYEMF